VLVQSVQTNLVQADADATNSFLAFGLEPRAQRVDYINAIETASRDLAKAVNDGPADALGSANAALTRYTGYVSSARANNLQGLPVGASYLQTASDLLQTGILPQLEAAAKADTEAIDSAYSRAGRAAIWLALVVVLGLGVLVWAQVYLAQHSRRIINVPLAAGTVGLLVAVIVAASAMVVSQSQANDVRTGDLAQARALSASRVAAFNAKSIESLTLIARGSGSIREPDWKAEMEKATRSLPIGNADALAALNAYAAEHAEIRKLDDNGNWQAARNRAIATGKSSANAQFDRYAEQTEKALTTSGTPETCSCPQGSSSSWSVCWPRSVPGGVSRSESTNTGDDDENVQVLAAGGCGRLSACTPRLRCAGGRLGSEGRGSGGAAAGCRSTQLQRRPATERHPARGGEHGSEQIPRRLDDGHDQEARIPAGRHQR